MDLAVQWKPKDRNQVASKSNQKQRRNNQLYKSWNTHKNSKYTGYVRREFGLVLCYINYCGLFDAKSGLYIDNSYIWFVNVSQQN